MSHRCASRVARLAISTFRYHSMREPRTALRMREIAQTRVRYGNRKTRVLNRQGWKVGKKLVYRLYREEGLALRHSHGGSGGLAAATRTMQADHPQPGVEPGFVPQSGIFRNL